jgi:hypothetical protein
MINSLDFGPGIPAAQTVKGAIDSTKAGDQLIRNVFNHIIASKENWSLKDSIGEASVLEINAVTGNQSRIDIIHTVDKILEFLSKVLHDFTSCTNQNTPFLSQIGAHIYSKIADLFITNWLSSIVPKTYQELVNYSSDVAVTFINFEEKWSKNSVFIPLDGKYMTKYCNAIVSISLESWRTNLLTEAREIILSPEYDYEIVEPYDASKILSMFYCITLGEQYPESEFDNILQFPKCAVSKRALKLVDLLGQSINDAHHMDSEW